MVIVGAGRIGTALRDRADEAGLPCALVDRAAGPEVFEGPSGDPILLAIRNDDLLGAIAAIPAHRRADLVFLQNGALREFLRRNALARATRGILYVMVAARGERGVVGGTTYLTGPRGAATARWLGAIGITAEDVDWARFSIYEVEKLLWLAIFGPLCQIHGLSVGGVADAHRDEIAALVQELVPVARASYGVDPDRGWLTERLVAYSQSIPAYTASIKEWPWRNGWLRDVANRHGIATPLHDEALARAGHPPDPGR